MLITFTDAHTKSPIALNPNAVVIVFTASDEVNAGKTVIAIQGGSIVVDEDYNEVVGRIQGELND
jgi:uncharacterized protein YlzI (FlbEa/FlbD family)